MSFQTNPNAVKNPGIVEWPISTAVGKDMQSMEPWFIRRSPVLTRLLDTYGDELDRYLGWWQEVINQMFVRTSTWGLAYWELELGLPYGGAKSDSERADTIIAAMRSYRASTPFVIRLVANSFNLGNVTPIEDFPGRRLIIRFNDIRGVPRNLADLQVALYRLVRNSAIFEYQFSYLIWEEVLDSGVLWCQLKTAGTTWEELRTMGPANLPTGVTCPAAYSAPVVQVENPVGTLTANAVQTPTGMANSAVQDATDGGALKLPLL